MTSIAAWLYANVLGNLVASAIWAIPGAAAFTWHHRHMRRRLDAIHQHITGSRLVIPVPAAASPDPHAGSDLRSAA